MKKLLLSVAVLALLAALPQAASAQTRTRLRAEVVPADVGRATGNSNYDERDATPRKIEVQVQNVGVQTSQIDAWIISGDFTEITYFSTFDVVGGIGRVELEIQFGDLIPQVREGDYIFLKDTATYDFLAYSVYLIDN